MLRYPLTRKQRKRACRLLFFLLLWPIFSNLNVHTNLGNLFKCRFWFSRSPVGPESTFPISFQDDNITIYAISITYDYKQIILILHGLSDGSSSVVFLIQALNLQNHISNFQVFLTPIHVSLSTAKSHPFPSSVLISPCAKIFQ